jgi:hypothetical protein
LLLAASYLVVSYLIEADRAASYVPRPSKVVPRLEPSPQGPTPTRPFESSTDLERAA